MSAACAEILDMNGLVVALIVALLLAGGSAILAFRRLVDHRKAAQQERVRHADEVDRIAAQHASEQERARQKAQNDLLDQSRRMGRVHADERARHSQDLEVERARTAVFEQLAQKRLGWEAISRQAILEICAQLDIQAALLTNTTFLASGAQYARQIDHLLIVGGRVLLIEAKRWSGVVIDGMRPDMLDPALAALLPKPPRTGPFAIHATTGSDGTIMTRLHADAGSAEKQNRPPTMQARGQARELAALLRESLGSTPFVQTFVFYSNEDAFMYVEPVDSVVGSRVVTYVAAGADALGEMISAFLQQQSDKAQHSTESIVAALDRYTSDVIWTGHESTDAPTPPQTEGKDFWSDARQNWDRAATGA